jgi:hypothetical protein
LDATALRFVVDLFQLCTALGLVGLRGEVAIAYEKSKESEFKNVTQFIRISPVRDIVKGFFIGSARLVYHPSAE